MGSFDYVPEDEKKSRVSPLGVGSERQMTDSTCKRRLNLSDVIVSDSAVDA